MKNKHWITNDFNCSSALPGFSPNKHAEWQDCFSVHTTWDSIGLLTEEKPQVMGRKTMWCFPHQSTHMLCLLLHLGGLSSHDLPKWGSQHLEVCAGHIWQPPVLPATTTCAHHTSLISKPYPKPTEVKAHTSALSVPLSLDILKPRSSSASFPVFLFYLWQSGAKHSQGVTTEQGTI